MRLLALIAVLMCFAAPSVAQDTYWVETYGHAAIKGSGDRATAKRRALADAMLSAVLAGGAEIRGHTALQNANITADLTIMRPTGRILEHHIIEERQKDGIWRVKIRAMVGPLTAINCAGHQQLIVTAYAPVVNVDYNAPPWSVAMAHEIINDVIGALDRHPKVTLNKRLDRKAGGFTGSHGNDFNYDALTKGVSIVSPGGHSITPEVKVTVIRDKNGKHKLQVELPLVLHGTQVQTIRRNIIRQSDMPGKSGLAVLSGRSTKAIKEKLTADLPDTIDGMINALTCLSPVAHVTLNSGRLTVPIGRSNGLSRSSLAFVTDRSDNFAILEIVSLNARSAVLRPLDRTRDDHSFDGLEVTFLETGL